MFILSDVVWASDDSFALYHPVKLSLKDFIGFRGEWCIIISICFLFSSMINRGKRLIIVVTI